MQPRTLGTKKARYGSVERCIDFEVTPHLLRHTFLTRCFENGLDMKEVQYLAGHKTPELTMRIYLHYQAEERKKTTFSKVRKMSFAWKAWNLYLSFTSFRCGKVSILQKNQAIFVPHLVSKVAPETPNYQKFNFFKFAKKFRKIKTTRKTRGLKGPSRACCQLRLKTHEEFANRTSFTGRR